MDYWFECVSEALDEAGITATQHQINTIADLVEAGHDMYSEAHGPVSNPLLAENDQLRRDLKKERDKVACRVCNGSGLGFWRGYCSAGGECTNCQGKGFIY